MIMFIEIMAIFVVGCLLHFVYDLTHQNKIAAIFAAVNESIWEHIKIAVVPTVLWLIYKGIVDGFSTNLLVGAAMSLAVTVVAIPALYYGYRALAKKDFLIVDIVIFWLAVAMARVAFEWVYAGAPACAWCMNVVWADWAALLAAVTVLIVLALVATCTFWPPKNFLFIDVRNGKTGLAAWQKMGYHHGHKKKSEH